MLRCLPRQVGARHRWPIFLVSSVWLRPKEQTPLVTAIVVGQEADSADDWIAERCCSGDIVVTQDTLLSARALKARARVLATPENCDRSIDRNARGGAQSQTTVARHERHPRPPSAFFTA